MNQKNIFTAIAVILMLQGITFFVLGDKVVMDAFPNLDENAYHALKDLMEVVAALSFLTGIIAYACRTFQGAVWAFTVGVLLLLVVTLKHMFVDHINVPIPAVIIQVLIALSCGYLWSQGKKA